MDPGTLLVCGGSCVEVVVVVAVAVAVAVVAGDGDCSVELHVVLPGF